MESVELASGHRMPMICLGTWRLTGKRCESAIDTALGLGYRHIDTAVYYRNHREIGRAIRACGDRSDLFLTSKVSPGAEDYNRTLDECDATLDELYFWSHFAAGGQVAKNLWKDGRYRKPVSGQESYYLSGKIDLTGGQRVLREASKT